MATLVRTVAANFESSQKSRIPRDQLERIFDRFTKVEASAKPFDENELLARVRNLIRERAQERELIQLQKEKIARFLPPNLADMIVAGDRDDFLKGHRAEITVVFIDLRGFTAFAETKEPETLMKVLKEYQTEMAALISQYQGTLERFSGDALMVYFNDPIPVSNHAEQAVRMGIAVRDRRRGRLFQRLYGPALGAGASARQGEACQGNRRGRPPGRHQPVARV